MVVLFALSPVQFEGQQTFDALAREAREKGMSYLPMRDRVDFFARKFIGKPYVGGTLDQNPNEEVCFVSLERLDCVTFVESVIGLARTRWNSRALVDENRLIGTIEQTRYRNGVVKGYLSRLHYTSDWIFDNQKRGNVKDISKQFPGAMLIKKTINFMSVNFDKYPALKANPALLPELKAIEANISARERWIVPKEALLKNAKQLKSGTMIAFGDSRYGLDNSHVGLILIVKGVPMVAHASSKAKMVVLEDFQTMVKARNEYDGSAQLVQIFE